VADFTPQHPAGKKIKRGATPLQIQLQPTVDIAAELGRKKTEKQILVGFALETDHELFNAQKKMTAKNLDMIVLNSLNDEGAGFGFDTNKVTLLYRNGTQENSGLKPKSCIAADIIDAIQSIK
jgi:phosphopantothenoylcysteine decarboxylase/phosphopantothenate--cysteine ligase